MKNGYEQTKRHDEQKEIDKEIDNKKSIDKQKKSLEDEVKLLKFMYESKLGSNTPMIFIVLMLISFAVWQIISSGLMSVIMASTLFTTITAMLYPIIAEISEISVDLINIRYFMQHELTSIILTIIAVTLMTLYLISSNSKKAKKILRLFKIYGGSIVVGISIFSLLYYEVDGLLLILSAIFISHWITKPNSLTIELVMLLFTSVITLLAIILGAPTTVMLSLTTIVGTLIIVVTVKYFTYGKATVSSHIFKRIILEILVFGTIVSLVRLSNHTTIEYIMSTFKFNDKAHLILVSITVILICSIILHFGHIIRKERDKVKDIETPTDIKFELDSITLFENLSNANEYDLQSMIEAVNTEAVTNLKSEIATLKIHTSNQKALHATTKIEKDELKKESKSIKKKNKKLTSSIKSKEMIITELRNTLKDRRLGLATVYNDNSMVNIYNRFVDSSKEVTSDEAVIGLLEHIVKLDGTIYNESEEKSKTILTDIVTKGIFEVYSFISEHKLLPSSVKTYDETLAFVNTLVSDSLNGTNKLPEQYEAELLTSFENRENINATVRKLIESTMNKATAELIYLTTGNVFNKVVRRKILNYMDSGLLSSLKISRSALESDSIPINTLLKYNGVALSILRGDNVVTAEKHSNSIIAADGKSIVKDEDNYQEAVAVAKVFNNYYKAFNTKATAPIILCGLRMAVTSIGDIVLSFPVSENGRYEGMGYISNTYDIYPMGNIPEHDIELHSELRYRYVIFPYDKLNEVRVALEELDISDTSKHTKDSITLNGVLERLTLDILDIGTIGSFTIPKEHSISGFPLTAKTKEGTYSVHATLSNLTQDLTEATKQKLVLKYGKLL